MLATELHGCQTRKGTTIPYISHLLSVAALVMEADGDEEMAVAALLHDAAEDQGLAFEDIEAAFGRRVSEIVKGCSDMDADDAPEQVRDQSNSMARKEAYLKHLEGEERRDILRVSLCDKLHNARTILSDYRALGDELWSRFNVGKDGQIRYYSELARIFSDKFPNDPQSAELDRIVSVLNKECDPSC